MKRNKTLSMLILLPLLTSCGETVKEKALFDENSLSDPLSAYTMLNNYTKDNLNYLKTTTYEIKSKSGKTQKLLSYVYKDGESYYSQKSSYSSLYGSSSFQLYFNENNSQYAVSKGSEEYKEETTLTSSSYEMFTYYSKSSYLENIGTPLNSLTNFAIYEDNEKLSFTNYSIKEEDDNYIIYEYELSLFSSINENEEYLSIDATQYEKNEIKNYCDFDKISISSASFTMTYDKLNQNVSKINVNESIKLNSIECDFNYESTFTYLNENDEIPSFYSSLKENISTNLEASSLNAKKEIYQLYYDLNKKYQGLNYYTYTDATANAMGGMYKQTVKGFKLKIDQEYLFTTITTSSFVKKAELRYEDLSKNIYKIGDGNNPDSSSVYGSVSSWNEIKSYEKQEYLSILGHTMENLTNFIVNKDYEKSFLDASMKEEGDEKIYSYTVSLTDSSSYIDATKEYKVEMNHMSGMGEPVFSSASFDLYIDKTSGLINKIVEKDSYKTGSFSIDYYGTTYFKTYTNINEVPSQMTSLYNEKIK